MGRQVDYQGHRVDDGHVLGLNSVGGYIPVH